MTKKQLGQFFTVNSDYILQGLEKYLYKKRVTDPFAGNKDLMIWAKRQNAKSVAGFDIDKRLVDNKKVFWGDSLADSRSYDFVLTNPPYLYINKADKVVKEKYFNNSAFSDLYQISLSKIMDSKEGIVIVPINFLSAENSRRIRNLFFGKFKIVQMNYFKQQVFSDTTYNVIAFYYKLKENIFDDNFCIDANIFPGNKKAKIKLEKRYDWTIGGDFLHKVNTQSNNLGISRFTEDDIEKGEIEITAAFGHLKNRGKLKINKNIHKKIKSNILLLKAIDTGTDGGKISLENIKNYGVDCLVSKQSSRNQVYLIFAENIPLRSQEKIIDLFNQEVQNMREKYLSLFMTNFRDNDRKRISFDFAYRLINHLYYNKINRFYASKQSPLF